MIILVLRVLYCSLETVVGQWAVGPFRHWKFLGNLFKCLEANIRVIEMYPTKYLWSFIDGLFHNNLQF